MLKGKKLRLQADAPASTGIHAGDLKTTSVALSHLNAADKLVRVQACIALGLLSDKSTTQALLQLLKTEKEPEVRQSAVKSLGMIADGDALPVLQADVYYVRSQATSSIDQIMLDPSFSLPPSPPSSHQSIQVSKINQSSTSLPNPTNSHQSIQLSQSSQVQKITQPPQTHSSEPTQASDTPAPQLGGFKTAAQVLRESPQKPPKPSSSKISLSTPKPSQLSSLPSQSTQVPQPSSQSFQVPQSSQMSRPPQLNLPKPQPSFPEPQPSPPSSPPQPSHQSPPSPPTTQPSQPPSTQQPSNIGQFFQSSQQKTPPKPVQKSTKRKAVKSGNIASFFNASPAKKPRALIPPSSSTNSSESVSPPATPLSSSPPSSVNYVNGSPPNCNINTNNSPPQSSNQQNGPSGYIKPNGFVARFGNVASTPSLTNSNTNSYNNVGTFINTTIQTTGNIAASSYSKHPTASLSTFVAVSQDVYSTDTSTQQDETQRFSQYVSSFATRSFGSQAPTASTSIKKTKRKTATTSSDSNEPTIKLSPEQSAVLDMAKAGRSFFFTGSAGTGKSLLLREIVREMRIMHGSSAVHVTASTGVAACNIGGVTVYWFAGVGLGDKDPDTLVNQAQSNKNARERWTDAKVLLIDEVSMLQGDFFNKLEYMGRKIREDGRPFGGIQVILCGDFFQLPPVTKSGSPNFCFDTPAWRSVVENRCVELCNVYRQKDQNFVSILNEARFGFVAPHNMNLLRQCMSTVLSTEDGIQPTRLYSLKAEVEQENKRWLDKLNGNTVIFRAVDSGRSTQLQQLQKNCPAPEVSYFKLGAQVILIKNLDVENELVNGARGVIVDFKELDAEEKVDFPGLDVFPVVKFISGARRVIQPIEWSMEVGGDKLATRTQIPLALAWALSIHKSQGMTIEKLEVNLGSVFEDGQAYVALSRATSMATLKIVGDFKATSIKTNPKILQFHNTHVKSVYNIK